MPIWPIIAYNHSNVCAGLVSHAIPYFLPTAITVQGRSRAIIAVSKK